MDTKKSAQLAPEKKTSPKSKSAGGEGKLRFASVSPSFTVDNLEKSLAWYTDVLGFEMGEKWEHEGKLMGAEITAGDASFMIAQDDWKKGRDRKKGEGFRLYCETRQDVDDLARAIESRGGKLDAQPEDHDWGGRDFSIVDPDGFKITIGRAS